MTRHDSVRAAKAMTANGSKDREALIDAICALQSTDDPSLVPLHDELQKQLAALDKKNKR